MSLFSRRRRSAPEAAQDGAESAADVADEGADGSEPDEPDTGVAADDADDADDAEAGDEADPAGARGPWDVDDPGAPDLTGRVNLGALVVPAREGMQLRMELDKKTRRVIAANVTLGSTSLQVQAFAAPRSSGLWDEIREELTASVRSQGGTVDDVPGPFGRELVAALPVKTRDGRTGTRPARFLGVDGPRWFLRGVITGAGVRDAASAAEIEAYFTEIVVVRGPEARPPRELLALHVPGKADRAIAPPAADGGLEILRRGPEITEVR